TMTTVALIERVNGRYRFVARGESITTHGWPWSDVTVGLRAAARQIEQLVGRTLFRADGTLIRPRTVHSDGVDLFVAVSSAAPPMRTVLIGLTEMSVRSGQRALAAVAGVQLMERLSLDRGTEWRDPNTWMTALQRIRPELVVLVGGCDGRVNSAMLDLVHLVALYNRLLPPAERPLVCYAGNAQLAETVAQAFAGSGELRVMANVRPSPETENILRTAWDIEALYQERRLMSTPGMSQVAEWAEGAVIPTARSFAQLVHYVGARYALNVIGFDVGSGQITVASYAGRALDGVPAVQRDAEMVDLTVRADLGVGWNIPSALQQIAPEQIARWLPDEMDAERIWEILLNKSVYPQSVPVETTELLVEHAFAREVMRIAWAAHRDLIPAKGWDLILGSGRILTRSPAPGYPAVLFLDTLEPVGVTQLAVDVGNIATTLGAMAKRNPLAATDVVEYDAFLTLGTLVATSGSIVPGDIAVRLKIRCRDGSTFEEKVPGGTLRVVPLPPHRLGTLVLHPARKIDVGVGRPGTDAVAEVEGGTLGILVDTRGRPLSFPSEAYARCRMVRGWLEAVLSKQSHRMQTDAAAERIRPAA
ncbi:MAG: glutamate mutase L, partial [Anaerolineae bacterium]|nr:glutamate mutase L [Anaerolineae bacterium]